MSPRSLLTIILAAGEGRRMKSALPKVLHRIGGASLLGHVLETVRSLGGGPIAIVVAPGMADVRAEALRHCESAEIFTQERQLGTAHAVLAARDAIARHAGDVLVVFADTPLLKAGSLKALQEALSERSRVAVLGFEAVDPTGYGRIVRDASGEVVAIREHKDASEEERQVRFCCSGVLAFRGEGMLSLLDRIGSSNANAEYYLTEAVALARADGSQVGAVMCPEDDVLGINTRIQLAAAEATFQRRNRERIMADGATLIAPETVWLSYDTVVGRDVTIEPNVFLGPKVTVEDGVHIMANCHMEGVRIRRGARVGPFARFRPGADIGPGAHIGNFVEVKNTVVGAGAKANHLAYLGDGQVGEKANIGAGTIFCNYDGYFKHKTEIGAGAFIGSNTSLVAPIKIGDGAYIGSGSIITKDVPADALALERAPQQVKPEWAAKFRSLMARRRPAKG